MGAHVTLLQNIAVIAEVYTSSVVFVNKTSGVIFHIFDIHFDTRSGYIYGMAVYGGDKQPLKNEGNFELLSKLYTASDILKQSVLETSARLWKAKRRTIAKVLRINYAITLRGQYSPGCLLHQVTKERQHL